MRRSTSPCGEGLTGSPPLGFSGARALATRREAWARSAAVRRDARVERCELGRTRVRVDGGAPRFFGVAGERLFRHAIEPYLAHQVASLGNERQVLAASAAFGLVERLAIGRFGLHRAHLLARLHVSQAICPT